MQILKPVISHSVVAIRLILAHCIFKAYMGVRIGNFPGGGTITSDWKFQSMAAFFTGNSRGGGA